MTQRIMRLLAIAPGEGRRTLLLYSLHLLFYIGLFWGEQASEALFLSSWGADNLAITFVGTAVLSLAVAAVYLPLADRWSNGRTLEALTLALIVWLVSIRLLLAHASGHSIVYPYFYMVYSSARDLSTLVILNFINDFYDTRAAKRAIPLMLSAAVAGSAIAGFSNPLLGDIIGVGNVPYAWIACLVGSFVLIRLVSARYHPVGIAGDARGGRTQETSTMRQRLQFVRRSSLLRWLTISTFAMVALMRLLNFEASRVFVAHFAGRPGALFNFYGLFGGIVSLLGFLLQSLLIGRLVAWLGVSEMYMVFPTMALAAIGVLGIAPSFASAIYGRLSHTVLKQSFRNPLDALVFNSVPVRLKNGAKALVNGVVVPLGTLGAGLALIGVEFFHMPVGVITAIGIAVALLYLFSSLRVRREYSRALGELVAEGTVFSYLERADLSDFERPDPALKPVLDRYIAAEQSEGMVAFLGGLSYELWGRDALPALRALITARGPAVRAAVIALLGRDFAADPGMRDLLVDALRDQDADVRYAAATAVAALQAGALDRPILAALREFLRGENSDEAKACALTALLRVPDDQRSAEVQATLAAWTEDGATPEQRLLALDALSGAGDPRAVSVLDEAARSPVTSVRHHAALASRALPGDSATLRDGRINLAQKLLSDDEPAVRLAAVSALGEAGPNAVAPLTIALGDPDDRVRRSACAAALTFSVKQLGALLDERHPLRRQSAAYLLSRRRAHGASAAVLDVLNDLASEMETRRAQEQALRGSLAPAARALHATLHESVGRSRQQALWLLGALADERAVLGIARGLESDNALSRSNAAEALEALTSPRLARRLLPLLSEPEATDDSSVAPLPAETRRAAVTALLPGSGRAVQDDHDGWIAALALATAVEEARGSADGSLHAVLTAAASDERLLVQDAARDALARIGRRNAAEGQGRTMLTAIEKAIFLKGVPLFDAMPIDRIRALAGISREANYAADEEIFAESDPGDCLFVVVHGRVGIQQRAGRRRNAIVRLATLGPRDYFGEVALFDPAPRDADAVALEPTQTLMLRREPFVEVIRQYPHLALDLLGVFTQKLRDANATIAAKTAARPKELVSLYDKL
jgi:CRP-like cAMP-binding protein/HEAT repeat protein